MSTTPRLFTPFHARGLEIRNRAWVSPMCQYSVETTDGVVADWHQVHYGSLAAGGWGLVMSEAAAVLPEGRISPWDAGLWNDEHVAAWRRINDFMHEHGASTGVQLAHAGRKASTNRAWPGFVPRTIPGDEGGWQPVGPTEARADGAEYTAEVKVLDEEGIAQVVEAFARAAVRAEQAGFDVVEVHAAHGYLLHQFYSPLSNTRDDQWGGSFENRVRLTLQVVEAIRERYQGVLFVRLSATDWTEGGWTLEDAVRLAALLKERGVDLVDTSSGGNVLAEIPVGPGYQVPFAERIRRDGGIATSAVGIIETPSQAETILATGQADAVMLGREALRDINWPLRAAHQLGVANADAPWPSQRWRGCWR
ncbi:NADH:flavin oxidoreductase/NADH oxidase [Luteococcus sp. OSA5]|uniref:NADH:flavin oxidoreductase/NADH oxidase n=1 Tax=Luteococcus sp. OSA5 TaxID=3401630 RepID=UPI003B4355B5